MPLKRKPEGWGEGAVKKNPKPLGLCKGNLALKGCNCLPGGWQHHLTASTSIGRATVSPCSIRTAVSAKASSSRLWTSRRHGSATSKGICSHIRGFTDMGPGLPPASSFCREHADQHGGGGCKIPSPACPSSRLQKCLGTTHSRLGKSFNPALLLQTDLICS